MLRQRLKYFAASKFGSVQRNHRSVWSVDRVVRSPCEDIVIPKTTLVEYVWKNLDKWADKTAVVCGITNRGYTYSQLYEQSRTFGVNLRSGLGIQDGDSVAITLPNMPEYPTSVFGVLKSGGVVTPINPSYTSYEIQLQLEKSEAKLVITTPEILPKIREAFKIWKKDIPVITITGDAPKGTIPFGEVTENKDVKLDVLDAVQRVGEDICVLPYSSGTTGLPKGVEVTNNNIVANCEQMNHEFVRHHNMTTDTNQDVILGILPFFHCYAFTIVMTHKLSLGATIVTLPRFSPETFLNALTQYNVSIIYSAPPVILFLGSHPDVTSKHLESVNTIMCGAAPLPNADIQNLFAKAEREFVFIQGYGLTETGPLVTLSTPKSKNHTTVGHALPNVELRVVDGQMSNVGPNEVGELLIKGPNVMKGYRNNPVANKESLIQGGWFRSGDLAKIDEEGVVTIVDRLKELIKVKGFQVPPAELEAVLKEHPAVEDAAVIGVPDGKTGEKPKAFIVPKEGMKVDENIMKDFVNERVAKYKRINDFVFLESIPKNPSGKILRRVLKEKYTDTC